MKKTRLTLAILFFLTFLLIISPALFVKADYLCPDTKAGDTKILKVTTVDDEGLTGIFGENWSDIIEGAFGEGADVKNAKLKSVVQGINSSDTATLLFIGDVDACNITVNTWNWTVGTINDEDMNPDPSHVIVIKNPDNLTAYVQALSSFLMMPSNVTVPWGGEYLLQLPVPASDYLADLIWEDDWSVVDAKVVHDAPAGYLGTYQEDCTETWEYYDDNGAFIGYKLVNNESTTVYEFKIQLPFIPGFDLSIVLGITVISVISIIFVLKKRK